MTLDGPLSRAPFFLGSVTRAFRSLKAPKPSSSAVEAASGGEPETKVEKILDLKKSIEVRAEHPDIAEKAEVADAVGTQPAT